jgi:hypothetical protein
MNSWGDKQKELSTQNFAVYSVLDDPVINPEVPLGSSSWV